MKTTILAAMTLIAFTAFAQKKDNGTIYIDHPAIAVVEDMTKAFVNGDSEKVASYLADDFRAYNGVSLNLDDKGQDKIAYSKTAKQWKDDLDYFSITRSEGAYPDALEYKKDNTDDVVWVQTWEDIKGVHKKTGVKVNMPTHRLFIVDKNNKIKTIIAYSNMNINTEINQSQANRTNGTIYNHHENINTVRKAVYAFEQKDVEKVLGFFTDDATFMDINTLEPSTKDEVRKGWQEFLNAFEIKYIEMVGYPDYLEYEMNNGREVLSWWNYHLVRKSDKKAMVIPIHFSHSFDADGKITNQAIYYSNELLNKK